MAGKTKNMIAAAFAFAALLAACKENGKTGAAPVSEGSAKVVASPFKIPEKYSELLNGYRGNWTSLTGFEFSGLHWGQYISLYVSKDPDRYVKNYLEYVRIYLNQDIDESDESTEEKHFENYTTGTIFLKENYLAQNGKPGTPSTVTVMIKQNPGYDPAGHDWQFLQFDVNGNILFDGNTQEPATQQMCIKCHGNMAERDFVFSTFCSIAPKESTATPHEAPATK
jgi:hypothetical protein